MKIKTNSAGVLDNFNDVTVIEERTSLTISQFLDFLDQKLQNNLMTTICAKRELREGMSLLLNGRSIKLFPEGLNTPLTDGDTVFICVVIAGG